MKVPNIYLRFVYCDYAQTLYDLYITQHHVFLRLKYCVIISTFALNKIPGGSEFDLLNRHILLA